MDHEAIPLLTEREIQVLRLVAEGLTNKEISRALEIKPRTVEFHLCNIFQKLNVTSRTSAALLAQQFGLPNKE